MVNSYVKEISIRGLYLLKSTLKRYGYSKTLVYIYNNSEELGLAYSDEKVW